jgi:hypothetical protein
MMRARHTENSLTVNGVVQLVEWPAVGLRSALPDSQPSMAAATQIAFGCGVPTVNSGELPAFQHSDRRSSC